VSVAPNWAAAGAAPLVAHGRLPDSAVEWGIFAVAAVVTGWVLWKAVRYTMRPGETEPDHVKRSILTDDGDSGGRRPDGGARMSPHTGEKS
jgi:hypothetical protein